MNLASPVSRVPFNADLVRSKGVNLSQQLAVLAPLADCLAEQVGIELSLIAQMPLKVTLLASTTEKLGQFSQIEAGHDLVSESDTVSCWSRSDTEFDRMMCDICLGGTGGGRVEIDSDRPSSLFDKKLRALIDERIARAAARALGEVSELEGISTRPRARMAARKAGGTRLCYSVRLLLNVFDQACEYEILMSFAECVKLIGGGMSSPVTAAASAATLMEKTPFSIDVFLKPDVLDIRQILNLSPGEVLKLNVSASTPVQLKMNGTELSRGTLRYDKDGAHIRLIDTAASKTSTGIMPDFTSLRFRDGN